MNNIFLVDVKIINNKLNQSFTYMIDSILYKKIAYGDLVLVEFNNKLEVAIIENKKISKTKPSFKINEVFAILKNNRINKRQEKIINSLEEKLFIKKEEVINLVMNKNEVFNTKLILSIKKESTDLDFEILKKKYFTNDSIAYKKIEKEDRKIIKELIKKEILDINLDEDVKYIKVYKLDDDDNLFIKKDFLNYYDITNYKFGKLQKEGRILETQIEDYKYKEIFNYEKKEIKLTKYQEEKLEEIKKEIDNKPVLLHGITGSGKTSLFIKMIEEQLSKRKKVLVLVPEITLVVQMVEDLQKYFGNVCGVFNNALTLKQKNNFIKKINTNNLEIIISTRSGIFLDIENLGLVIVDEEHDSSYKQNFNPFYHVDDMIDYWEEENINVLLSSATPRLISYTKAKKGLYHLVSMNKRYNDYSLPTLTFKPYDRENLINKDFINNIKDTLEKKENCLILFNVKGYASSIECPNCGNVEMCPDCNMPLKYYKSSKKASCNYCDFQINNYNGCSNCNNNKMSLIGLGIEKVQEQLENHFPNQILRVDSKVSKTKEKVNNIIKEFNNNTSKILIGTQIIAKGLNFKNLNKVIVLNLDNMLFFNDFNSHEKAYQLLEQVSGRSGRDKKDGEVIVYTNHSDDVMYQAALNHDYNMFYNHEMENRKLQKVLPYYFISQIEFRSKHVYKYEEEILKIKENLEKKGLIVTKIVQPYLENIGEEKRLKIYVKYKKENIKKIIQEAIELSNIPKGDILVDLNIENYGL